ncbi:hypothetical protein SAMN04487891_11187 [Flagellimonas taeanensis]|uniref:Universal stress protein family protein n=1 Tax=Flagellimonas taeanensis TaxID=1005926 RepID=A0A1M6WAZ2_9FLAO|nr:hypothetical protein SAMN04487891_11187 [Allomuricauda taeanensis]SHK90706.1 hypothetical protein SAMN05216293_2223 [Allomuricauda taeanensis]
MKNILLPTDFSNNVWNAIFMATKLYAPLECRFMKWICSYSHFYPNVQ